MVRDYQLIKSIFNLIILLVLLYPQTSVYADDLEYDSLNIDNKILLLYDRLMFNDIIKIYNNNDIDINELSPDSLMILCSALNEIEYDVKDFLRKQNAEHHIIEFSLAYTELIQGKAVSAEKKFHTLRNSLGMGQYFGMIGLFEYALFTMNHSELNERIQKEKGSTFLDVNDLNEIIDYYSILYNSLTGNMNNIVEILKNIDINIIEKSLELSLIQVEILIFQNNLDDALILIDSMLTRFGHLQEILLKKYNLINIKYGADSGIKFLENINDDQLWKIKLAKYCNGLESNDNDIQKSSLKNIISLANSRLHDIQYILGISNHLLDCGYYVEAGTLINNFLRKTDNQAKFFMSNFFLSKFFYITNEMNGFTQSYANAIQQSSRDYDFLWFQCNISIDKNNNEEALRILDQILLFDPFDEYAIYEKMLIYFKVNDFDNVILLSKQIHNSQRFIEPLLKNKINTLLEKASSSLDSRTN